MKKGTIVELSLLIFSLAIITSCGSSEVNGSKLNPEITSVLDSVNSKTIIEESKKVKGEKEVHDSAKGLASMKIIEQMKDAYIGEITAKAKYAAYSKTAEKDGFHSIAILYKAVSFAESIHARNHKEVLQQVGAAVPAVVPEFVVKSTKENLHDDINGEADEATNIYPSYLKLASDASNDLAYTSIMYAMKTEKKHRIFFENALGDINSNMMKNLPSVYFVCPVCGNTYESFAPKLCDFSFTPKDKFIKISSL